MDVTDSSSDSKPKQLQPVRIINGDSQRLLREISQTSKKREAADQSHLSPMKKSPKQRRKSLANERQARDPRDEARTPSTSRHESPFTMCPAVDFDGLSWPSE